MLKLRPPHLSDESLILEWRNSPEVAPYMLRDTVISQDEHHDWFTRVIEDNQYSVVRVLEDSGQHLGLVSLTHINQEDRSCEWGGYLAPGTSRGTGLGRALLYLSLKHAFENLKLKLIKIEVIVGNEPARRLYESCGFEFVELITNRAERGTGAVDVLRYHLTLEMWTKVCVNIRSDLIKRGLF
jgi:UDP-4-amino-4,6-dideoxy-N-acetyl-beta-L-altrosamine N-acetyltransferase